MPNYDWQCSEDHAFEKYIPLAEWRDKMRIPCEVEDCKAEAHQVVLPRGTSTTIQPFVYFLNAQGEVRIPGTSSLATPKGHTRCEATTLHELRQLEKRCGVSERSKISQSRELEDYYESQTREEDRRELRSAMSNFSQAGKDFAQAAIQRTNNKRNFTSFDPGYHFEVLHNDESRSKREYEG